MTENDSVKCHARHLLGGTCFYDEHLAGTDDLVVPFMDEGEKPIWDALESAYASLSEYHLEYEILEYDIPSLV